MLPSLLIGSVPTPALPFLLFLFPRQLFHFYYLCFHTCSSIFTVSAPTLALSFLLCQLPHLHFHLCCFCSYSCTDFSTASVATLALSFSLFRVSTVREKSWKTKIFKVREKLENFLKSQGKFLILSKSENSVFRFIDQNFSSRLEMHFLWQRLNVCCKASKAINLTLYDSM